MVSPRRTSGGQSGCSSQGLRRGWGCSLFGGSAGSTGGPLAGMSVRSQPGFNSQVLHVARSDDCEFPWLFVLTLSGLEVMITLTD